MIFLKESAVTVGTHDFLLGTTEEFTLFFRPLDIHVHAGETMVELIWGQHFHLNYFIQHESILK